ncbi:uncharacterized protein C8Q71DRAFT_862439 [Rhodofomes roseus]|uniref:Uncharacterized protein n=1 Tax=Rhodofomes roseus TaxID=34475 RepID=A0ABQ8K1T7_9APHY|nr:uncharacterized protein C8Q71DRAFT_862439 [Rhodofomes roseus]KAH9830431.1 hypothetical protein C8Q71DRAFT_862439 [Rhodofomes roseus]
MANPNYELQLTHLLQPGVSEPLDPRRSFSITGLEGCYLNGDLRLYECVITDLWLYKRANLSNHEYIVLKVRYNARDIGFLRVERTIDRSEANGSSWTISTISSTSSTASASSSFAIPAKDIITLCTTENRNLLIVDEEQIAHATLDPPPTLAAVVAACLVVNREKPFYELLTGQCYWFAGVVIRLICDDHTNMQPVPSATRKEGEWRNFLGVMSDARMNEKAKKLRSGYRATLTTLRDQATSRARVPQEAERKVEEADRRAEEERRQREEAERQREEAERQREEERRQREEAERRAEEAERKAEDFQRMYKDLLASGSSTAAALAAAATTTRQA